MQRKTQCSNQNIQGGRKAADNLQDRLAFPYLPLKDDIHTMGVAGDISHEANQVGSAPGSQLCSGSGCDG